MPSASARARAATLALTTIAVVLVPAATSMAVGRGHSDLHGLRSARPVSATLRVASGPVRLRAAALTTTGTAGPSATAAVVGAPRSTWQVTYTGFTPQAQAAFQAAVDIWAGIVASPVPIKVSADFAPTSPGLLGFAGASQSYSGSGLGDGSSYYPSALADAMTQQDVAGVLGLPYADIDATFSSSEPSFYFGTDGAPGTGQIDFESVVLHELGHGLGFMGGMTVTAGVGAEPDAMVFDKFGVAGAGTSLQSLSGTALGSALTGGAVSWNGSQGRSANGGVNPRLYAPSTWQDGSSFSHLDEGSYPAGSPDALMTPYIGHQEVIRSPGPLVAGMMRDVGWDAVLPAAPPGPDTTAPTVTLTSAPAGFSRATSAGFGFSGLDPDRPAALLSYLCSLDGAVPAPCVSGVSYSGLGEGVHTFAVRALDEALNASPDATYSWRVDTTAPTVTAAAQPTWTLGRTMTLTHTGTDSGSGVASFAVRTRRAFVGSGFGAFSYPSSWQARTVTSTSQAVASGYTYCMSVRAKDRAGNVSAWSPERCTSVPLDDRSLAVGAGWARGFGGSYYTGTDTATKHSAVTATRTGLQTRRLALVASTCATCGSVAVYWNGSLLRTVSLRSATTRVKQLLYVVDFGTVRSGTVVLRTTSTRAVYVDGLGASRV